MYKEYPSTTGEEVGMLTFVFLFVSIMFLIFATNVKTREARYKKGRFEIVFARPVTWHSSKTTHYGYDVTAANDKDTLFASRYEDDGLYYKDSAIITFDPEMDNEIIKIEKIK